MTSGGTGPARRIIGLLLVGVALLPVFNLLGTPGAGPAGLSTVAIADADQSLVRLGTVLILVLAALLSIVISTDRLRSVLDRLGNALGRPTDRQWTGIIGGVALLVSSLSALALHRKEPRLLDEMAQLLHARLMTSGRAALPIEEPLAAVLIQNSWVTAEGWASVYPPGHTVLLALGAATGLAWLVGPLLLGCTTVFLHLTLVRLLPGQRTLAHCAGLAAALSPFLVFLGSGYLSHTSAAAGSAIALYAAVRAWQGGAGWGIVAGAAVGLMVTSRPWTGLTLGTALTLGLWIAMWWREGRALSWLGFRLGMLSLGGAPFAFGFFLFNHRLFGNAFTLGYEVAFGPAHGLGLHRDPWGNLYGVQEAIGYTGADLATLGLRLFETPFSPLVLVGAFLLLAPRLSTPTRLLVCWALVPVAANFFYWHHGQHLGPRMLFESAPAWAALTVVSVAGLLAGGRDPALLDSTRGILRRRLPGVSFLTVALSLALGTTLLLPARIAELRRSSVATPARELPAPPTTSLALVFVHGSWPGRVGARLAASGMRRDSVETALRRNDLCRVHLYALAREGSEGVLPELLLDPIPGTPAGLLTMEVTEGLRIRVDGSELAPGCAREVYADRNGVIELAPLLWQVGIDDGQSGDRPRNPLRLVRDLGPDLNEGVLARYPEATAWMWASRRPGGDPELMPYEEGRTLLWPEGP